jgi:hypothetical protein
MTTVAALSAVLSNTTVVALFVQIVKKWANKLGTAPSKLLIPLSYASGLGGICTIIGTPPNLIISGMYAQDSGVSMGFFSTTIPGLACLIVGILSVLAMQRLLPSRKSPEDAFDQTTEYTVELLVPSGRVDGMRSHALPDLADDRRLLELCLAHRLPYAPAGLRTGRLPFHRLLEDRPADERHHPDCQPSRCQPVIPAIAPAGMTDPFPVVNFFRKNCNNGVCHRARS